MLSVCGSRFRRIPEDGCKDTEQEVEKFVSFIRELGKDKWLCLTVARNKGPELCVIYFNKHEKIKE